MFDRRTTSVFSNKGKKVPTLVLSADSTSMAYAACLRKRYNITLKSNNGNDHKLEFGQEQIADVFMNAFIVHMV